MFGRAMWAKATSRRSKIWLLAGVFLLSAVLSPFVASQPAYADTAGDIHDINYKHYAATYLRDCLFNLPNETKNVVLQARANDSNRFLASSHKVGIGLYLEPTDGLAGCEEGGLVSTALQSLGYANNPSKLLTDIGYNVDRTTLGCNVENPACENGTQNRYTRPPGGDKFNSVFANALGAQPRYAKYVAYMSIFNARCKLVEPPTGEGSAVTYKKVVLGGDGNYIIQDAKAEFVKNNPGRKDEFDTGRTQIKSFEYENQNTTCRDLLALVDTLTVDVQNYNNQNKDDPISTSTIPGGDSTDCTAKPDAEGCGEDAPTCTDQIKGIGWLICPTMEFLANINDMAYGVLASNFLQIDTGLVKGAEAPWAKFKDLANIAFVIALLFVIYSQVTSVGISNYGIKKMLPKIIVAALLVNLSFIICQIAVDLSNILGYGISRFFTGLEVGATLDSTTQDKLADEGLKTLGTALSWTGAIGLIMVAGVSIALAVSFPVVLSALLALAMIVLILLARKALIVLLIVIAPLAFVAYLLPNTEQWFKKWAKMFSTLLLLFPIIGVVFGASAVAAKIVAAAGGNKDDPDPLIQLAALAISALPFFVVPGLLKGAINAAGALGTKLSGFADRAGKNVGSSVKNRSQLGQTWKAARDYKEKTHLTNLAKRRGIGLNTVVGRVAGGKDYNAKARLRASDLEAAEFEDDVKSATNSFQPEHHNDVINMAKTGKKLDGTAVSEAEQVAAIRYTAKAGRARDVADIDSKGKSGRVRSAHVDAVKEKKLNNVVGNGVLSEIATGGTDGARFNDLVVDATNNGTIAASTIAQSDSTPAFIADAIKANTSNKAAKQVTREGYEHLQKATDKVYDTPATKAAMTDKMGADLNSIGITTK